MHKPLLFKPIGSPKELSSMLRPFPKKTEIPVIMKQEAKDKILYGPKNKIDFYFIAPEKDVPEKKGGLQPATNFKSIHNSTESKEKKRLLEKLVVPKYNIVEKQALKEVRKKEGKLYLLNDIYHEFSKDIEQKSKTDVRPIKKKKIKLEVEDEANQVEELDKWEKNYAMVKKLRETMNDHNAPSNRIQLKPLPPIIKGGSHNSSQSNLSLPKQQTEPAESLGRFIESPIKKEEKEQESILDFQDPLAVSPGTESIVKVVEDGEEDKMEHLIKIMDVIEESEGLEEVKAEIQRMLEGDEDYDIINGENSNGFSMKNLANYYKDINEKMEIRIAESIKQIKKAIQENKDMAEKTTKESEFLEEQIQQATKQLEVVGSIIASSCNFDQYDDDIDKEAKRKEISKESKLKEALESLTEHYEMNQEMLIKYDIEHKEYNGKLENLSNLQKQLYRAIIHQGVDSREEGLIWAMKKLYELGEQTTLKDFPAFLDQKSRKFLIDKLAMINELKQLTVHEKKNIEKFKAYKEQLLEHEVQFGSIFRDSRNLLDNSRTIPSFHIDGTSRGSVSASLDFQKGTMKDAFRLETIRTSIKTTSPEIKKEIIREELSPREEIERSRNEHKHKTQGDEPNSPDEGVNSEDTQESWAEDGTSPNRKLKRLTENEEIYLKAKKLMRDKLKDYETIQRSRSKLREENPNPKDYIKINGNFPNISYTNRRDFLVKMQNLNVEMKMRQEKMKDDLETEVIRIMNDYGRRGMIKNVDIGVYLMTLFGYTEAMRYLNRFKLRGRGVF